MAFPVSYIYEIVDRYSTVAKRMTAQTKNFQRQIKQAAKTSEQFRKKLKATGSRMSQFGRSMSLRVTAPVIASIAAFKRFDDTFSDVLTLLSREEIAQSEERLKGISKGAIGMGFSIQDSNKALFDAISALGLTENTLKTFEQGQVLAKAGATGLGIAVNGITSIVNAYGREITDANEVANAFFSAQKYGKTTVEELALNIGKVAPIAKQADIGFQELLATTAQLTLGGLSTDEATTALRATISALIKPGAQAAKIFKALNIPVGATAIQQAGLGKTLLRVSQVAEKYPDVLAQIIPNVRALTGVSALNEDALKNIQRIMKQINIDTATGTGLTEAYTLKMKRFGTQVDKLFGLLKLFAIQLSEDLAPALRVMVNLFGGLIKTFQKLPSPFRKVISFGIGLLAVLAPLLIVAGGLIAAIGFMLPAIVALTPAFSALAVAVGGFAVSAGAALLPLLPFIAAIGSVSAAVFMLMKHWNALKTIDFGLVFRGMLMSIEETFPRIFGFFKQMSGFIGKLFGGGDTLNVQGLAKQEVAVNNKSSVDINLNSPPGVIQSVATQGSNVRLGMNMAGAI